MVFRSKTFASVLFVAGVISIFESFVWILLAIYAILKFHCVFPTPEYLEDGFIYTTLYKFYLEGDECRVEGDPPGYPDIGSVNLTKPAEVYTWVIIYLIMSLIMLAISMSIFTPDKSDEVFRVKMKAWCSVVGIILTMDLILTGFFIKDFLRLQDHLKEDPKNLGSVPVVMFVLSAKGFALWLINLGLVIYFIVRLKDSQITEKRTGTVNAQELVRAYDNYGFNNSSEFVGYNKGKILDDGFHDRSSFRRRSLESRENRRDSVGSYEAVTPFNIEEYGPAPLIKPNFVISKNQNGREPRDENVCCEKGLNGTVYHGHSCSRLKSELELKLQTWRKKPEQTSSTLSDFSHDLKNFKRGPGKIPPRSEVFPQKENIWNKPPATGAPNSTDYELY